MILDCAKGASVGCVVGRAEGASVTFGRGDGAGVGAPDMKVGEELEAFVGCVVGCAEGAGVGEHVCAGAHVGKRVGLKKGVG